MLFDTFSQRKKRVARGDEPDVYSYDTLPPQLRHQICMIMHEAVGPYCIYNIYGTYLPPNANNMWEYIDLNCQKEIFPYLEYRNQEYLDRRYFEFLLNCQENDETLSAIEIGCLVLSLLTGSPSNRGATVYGETALEEINMRFRQHSVGYRYESKQLIRIDSEYAHSQLIKPALKILANEHFSKANSDFMAAHNHYRNGKYSDSVTSANRSFETMLKTICDLKDIPYKKGDRASELITIITSKIAIPFDKSFGAYVSMLKSGLPNIRNEAGAHGQGLNSAEITANVAQFAINMTASNMIFLSEFFRFI